MSGAGRARAVPTSSDAGSDDAGSDDAGSGAATATRARAVAGPHRRLRLHPAARRAVHPGAWWLWAGGLAAAAMRTTNVVLLGLLLAVVAYVVAARRTSAPWSRSFASFLRLGVVIVVIRVVLTVLFGARLPGTVVVTLPAVELPSWLAGVQVGGPVTVPMLVQAFTAGFRLAVLLACFGAVNALCSPYRMLRALPAVLYEAGVAVTVALAFAPEAVAAVGRLREARRLRGRPSRGLGAWRGLAMPVLEGALDRSVALAASMDTRGYGRRGDAPATSRRLAVAATAAGMLAVAVGLYGLLDAGAPRSLGLPALGAGAALLAVSLFAGGRRTARTRYRPDPWGWPEWVIAASGAAAFVGSLVAGVVDPAALAPATTPLTWPALAWPAVAGTLAALAPAVVAPLPPLVAGDPAAAGDGPTASPAVARRAVGPVGPGGPRPRPRRPRREPRADGAAVVDPRRAGDRAAGRHGGGGLRPRHLHLPDRRRPLAGRGRPRRRGG
ncbi:MAG: energy-coupling factor transporter transmembrane component T [Acidimicrobiales bacterium]